MMSSMRCLVFFSLFAVASCQLLESPYRAEDIAKVGAQAADDVVSIWLKSTKDIMESEDMSKITSAAKDLFAIPSSWAAESASKTELGKQIEGIFKNSLEQGGIDVSLLQDNQLLDLNKSLISKLLTPEGAEANFLAPFAAGAPGSSFLTESPIQKYIPFIVNSQTAFNPQQLLPENLTKAYNMEDLEKLLKQYNLSSSFLNPDMFKLGSFPIDIFNLKSAIPATRSTEDAEESGSGGLDMSSLTEIPNMLIKESQKLLSSGTSVINSGTSTPEVENSILSSGSLDFLNSGALSELSNAAASLLQGSGLRNILKPLN